MNGKRETSILAFKKRGSRRQRCAVGGHRGQVTYSEHKKSVDESRKERGGMILGLKKRAGLY